MTRSRAVVAAAACAAVLGPACARALAETQPGELPSPAIPLTAEPPLLSAANPLAQLLPGRLTCTERVEARFTAGGRVHSVVVLQRLVLAGRGDYSFAVTAPVEDVVAAAASQSEPGLREGAVLWQGFSAGRRLLAARLRLDPAAAAPVLPLRIRLVRLGPTRLRLTIANRTAARVTTYSAESVLAGLAIALDGTRADLHTGRVPRARPIELLPPIRRRDVAVGVPFRVRVAIVLPAGARVVRKTAAGLDAGGTRGVIPARGRATVDLSLSGPSRRLPSVRVTAVPVAPLELLDPPGAATWRELLARRGRPVDARRLLNRSLDAVLGIARARQYDRYVMNPDALGTSRATYVFRLVEQTAAPAAPAETSGSATVAILLLVLLLGGLAAGAIAWAHA